MFSLTQQQQQIVTTWDMTVVSIDSMLNLHSSLIIIFADALIGTGIVLALASVVSIATNVLMAVCVYHNIKKNLKNNSLIEKSKSSMGSNMPVQYIMDEGDNIMIHTQNQAYGQCGGMQSYQRSSTTSSYYY